MIRRHPRSTRTDTLIPNTTLSRSLERIRLLKEKLESPHMDVRGVARDSHEYTEEFVKADEDAYSMGLDTNSEHDTPWLRYGYTSRSEEHTSKLQSLMRISYAVFCLKKKKL